MGVSIIEQAKIQAQVLVPLVKALQAELGETRANNIVRKALGDIYRRHGEAFWQAKDEKNLGNIMASAFATYPRGDALGYRVGEQSGDAATPSSTRSWVSRSSASCWSAVRTSIPLTGSVPTSTSRARKPSCKAPVIAISGTSDRQRRIEGTRPASRYD